MNVSNTRSVTSLPTDAWAEVFRYLDKENLGRCAAVCTLWRDLVTETKSVPPPFSKRTVVVFTVPFQGHFDVLYRAAKAWQKTWNVKMVVCGWPNLGFPKCDGSVPYHYFQSKAPLKESCPTKFNLQRALDLRQEVLYFCREELKNGIDFIVYDFFALEGFLTARLLRIPHACSIPAVPGPFDPNAPFFKERLSEAQPLIAKLNSEWLGKIGDDCTTQLDGQAIQMVSDGFLVQGQQQLLWGVSEVSKGCVEWLQNKRWIYWPEDFTRQEKTKRTSVYISLGTVVTGNLWDCNPAVIPFVKELFERSCKELVKEDSGVEEIVISVPYRLKPLKALLQIDHPKIRWLEYANQTEELKKAQLFLTHGGGNSIREALVAKTPMLVVPFFGDQHVSASCIQKSGAGIALLSDDPNVAVDTHQKSFYRRSFANLETSLKKILTSRVEIQERIDTVVMKSLASSEPVEQALETLPLVPWKEGDLLFGTNVDRRKAAKLLSQREADLFHVGNMKPFSEYGNPYDQKMPRLIDQYHDVICQTDPQIPSQELQIASTTRYGCMMQSYQQYLKDKGLLPTAQRTRFHLWDCCVTGIRFFLEQGSTIHFVIDTFDYRLNKATRMELLTLQGLWYDRPDLRQRIAFYRLQPVLHRVDPEQERWFGVNIHVRQMQREAITQTVALHLREAESAYQQYLTSIQESVKPYDRLIWLQGRVKSAKSAFEKLDSRGFRALNDALGFRVIHTWTKNLYYLAEKLAQDPKLNIYRRMVSERGKVLYLFGKTDKGLLFEIQFWPTLMYTCFESEHDTVYKPKEPPKETVLEASQFIREEEHRLQNVIDSSVLVKFNDTT